jgi:hypothetical protein
MNTYDFFMENFGKFLLQDEGLSYELTARVLNSYHEGVGGKNPRRLGAGGWALIQPNKPTMQQELAAKGITYFGKEVSRWEAFGEVLNNWQNIPTIFIIFGKSSFSIENLFITVDLRHVRICEASGSQTFDYTQDPDKNSPTVHQKLFEKRNKNAA